MNKIEEMLSRPAIIENLAEEAAELAQAASKYARILRQENPTPVTFEEGYANLIEEFTDVVHIAKTLGLNVDERQMVEKNERWIKRLLAEVENERWIKKIIDDNPPRELHTL